MSTARAATPRSLRIPFVRRCTLSNDGNEQSAFLIDLSVAGVYITADNLPTEGDEVVLRFRVPGNDRLLEVQAIVVYVNRNQKHPVHSLPPGAGLRFRNLSVPDSRLIVGTIRAYCMSNPVYRQYL